MDIEEHIIIYPYQIENMNGLEVDNFTYQYKKKSY